MEICFHFFNITFDDGKASKDRELNNLQF